MHSNTPTTTQSRWSAPLGALVFMAAVGLAVVLWLLFKPTAGQEFPLGIAVALVLLSGLLARANWRQLRLPAPERGAASGVSIRWVLVGGIGAFALLLGFVGAGAALIALLLAVGLDLWYSFREATTP